MNKRRTFTIEERNNCVYIHTNKTNGKVYIGITGRNPLERWNNGKGYKLNPYFWKAIKKYGWNGFNHDILEDNLTREEAKEKEIYYIKKYDSTNRSKGYNIQRGGNLSYRPTVKQYDRKTGKFIKEWDCTISAERGLNIPNADISSVCNGKVKTAHDFYFTYENLGEQLPEDILSWINVNDCTIPVAQYDLEGNFVSKYHTLNEASKQFNGRIQLKNKLSFGYIWIPLDRNNPVCPIKLSPEDLEKYKYEQLGKRCYQYSLSGVFLKSYVSTQDAANTLKCSQSSIASVCRKLFFQSNGYIWRYAEDDYIEGVDLPHEETVFIRKGLTPVYQYDLNGNLLNKYDSVTEAANKYNMSTTNISKACLGEIKTAKGFIWRYEEVNFTKEELNFIKENKRKRKITQSDKDGNYLNTFESLADAHRITNIDASSISSCCNKRQKTAGGFIWEYAS